MRPSLEELDRWAVFQADGLVTLPQSAWHSVRWLLGVLEKMEADPAIQEAFIRAAGDGDTHGR